MKPWQMSASEYQIMLGVHEPWIAEISPWQYASMSKRQQKAYEKKRLAEWTASAEAKKLWRDKVIAAFDAGEINLDMLGLHPDAREAIRLELVFRAAEVEERSKQNALDVNRIASIDEVEVGDQVWSIMYRHYGTITRKFRVCVRMLLDNGFPCTEPIRALQWQSYDDVVWEKEGI